MVYYTRIKTTALDQTFVKLEKLKIWIFCGCFILGAAYFWQINSVATRGFKIRDLENNIQTLKEINQNLELQAAGQQTLEQVNERIKQLNMVAPESVDYLRPTGAGVAYK